MRFRRVHIPVILSKILPPEPLTSGSYLTINDITVVNEGVDTFAVFTVSRLLNSTSTCTVGYATVDGTAIAGIDYISVTGTLIFLPTETTKIISIPILADGGLNEPLESFTIVLSNPTNATLGNSTGICNIQDYMAHRSIATPTYPYPSFINY